MAKAETSKQISLLEFLFKKKERREKETSQVWSHTLPGSLVCKNRVMQKMVTFSDDDRL